MPRDVSPASLGGHGHYLARAVFHYMFVSSIFVLLCG
jgi:hypothetical protein